MTQTAPTELAAVGALPSRYDQWRRRVLSHPAALRRWEWLTPVIITIVALVLRLIRVGDPRGLVFDETYYVKDAWSQWVLGYASEWPDDADRRFAGGETDIFTGVGSYIVHPPLGKFLIGVGMWIFGPESTLGWRISAVIFGTACVLVLYFIARSLTGSFVFAGIAAGLFAIDGLGIVMSRVSLLDIFLTFFCLLAFWFVILDRRTHLDQLAYRLRARADGGTPAWGPVLWNRPWVIAAGLAGGAATGVKWSGVWVLAALGIYLVVTDALERRRLGITYWPMDAAIRQGPVAFVLLVPAALVVYLATWTGWIATEGGYDRESAYTRPATGFWSWVPLALQSLWTYHERIYGSMTSMTSSHPYASPAWQWPLLIRPTSMLADSTPNGENGCASASGCIEILYSMPNPIVWWASVIAAAWLIYRFARDRQWQHAIVLMGIGVAWVPWMLYPERTIFQFYTILMLPFLLLALTYGLQALAGTPRDDNARRTAGQRAVIVFLVVVVLIAAFWYPLWAGLQVPMEFYWLHNWLVTWV